MVRRRFHDVTRYGAVGDGLSDSTEAIAAAIAAASKAAEPGKHAVLKFPKGTFLTRPFNLSSWLIVEIHGTIKGATGNAAVRRWPQLPPLPSYGRDRDLTCTYGHPAKRQRYQALVFAADAQHLIIRGRGSIDGQGAWWWERAGCKGSGCRKKRAAIRAGRPHLVELYNCSHVEVSGVTLRDSPFWTLHPVYSQHVWIHHIALHAPLYAPNADGIDPDSSRHVLIEHNLISCGDDHVALKAGLSPVARDAFPAFVTENVTVRHNTLKAGMGISIGSETSGGIRDVSVHDNLILGEGWCAGLHLKTTPTRGNMVARVSFRHNRLVNTSAFMKLETNYQGKGRERAPVGYAPTAVYDLEWLNNSYEGRRTRSAWVCLANSSCRNIVVVNNSMPASSRWQCAHVASSTVAGNSPSGLEACMRESGAAPSRREGRGKWRKFNWQGAAGSGGRHGRTATATWEYGNGHKRRKKHRRGGRRQRAEI